MSLLDSSLDQTQVRRLLGRLGIGREQSGVCHEEWAVAGGEEIEVISPADGQVLASVHLGVEEDYDDAVYFAQRIWPKWRDLPAPKRGEIVREIGNELRSAKEDLGMLVSLEAGKILAEGAGRSAGDDRHRRLRSGAFAPALRPDHAQRTPGPSNV